MQGSSGRGAWRGLQGRAVGGLQVGDSPGAGPGQAGAGSPPHGIKQGLLGSQWSRTYSRHLGPSHRPGCARLCSVAPGTSGGRGGCPCPAGPALLLQGPPPGPTWFTGNGRECPGVWATQGAAKLPAEGWVGRWAALPPSGRLCSASPLAVRCKSIPQDRFKVPGAGL